MAKTRGEHLATMHRTRSSLTLGWEAARANALPALIIQALMLMLLVSFYTSHTAFALLSQIAELKRTGGILFVIVASVTAGALIPELFLILFFQRGRPSRRNLRNLLFTVPVWASRRNACRSLVSKSSNLVWRRRNPAGSCGENLRRSIWLQSRFRGAVWCADL